MWVCVRVCSRWSAPHAKRALNRSARFNRAFDVLRFLCVYVFVINRVLWCVYRVCLWLSGWFVGWRHIERLNIENI